jgi:hypothetical protein
MSDDGHGFSVRPVSEQELSEALRLAAESMEGAQARWAERVAAGLTDEALEAALRLEFGTFGGSCGRAVDVTFQGNGLKLWVDRCGGSRANPPKLEGQKTVNFARQAYGIPNPDDQQMELF